MSSNVKWANNISFGANDILGQIIILFGANFYSIGANSNSFEANFNSSGENNISFGAIIIEANSIFFWSKF